MVEEARIEHNENVIPDLSNQMSQGEFLHYMHRHKQIEDELDTVKAKRKKLRHHMERQGLNLEAFDAVRKEMGIAAEVLRERQETLAMYRGWADLPHGAQAELFSVEETEGEEAGTDPEQAGYVACMTGMGATSDQNPFAAGTEEAGKWHDGWLRGQQDLAKQLKKTGPEIGW